MRLSEAILKGCEIIPKQFPGWFATNAQDELEGACALGSAIHAMAGYSEKEFMDFICNNSYDDIVGQAIKLFPICKLSLPLSFGKVDFTVAGWLIYLNDQLYLSREGIAKRVAALEEELGYD